MRSAAHVLNFTTANVLPKSLRYIEKSICIRRLHTSEMKRNNDIYYISVIQSLFNSGHPSYQWRVEWPHQVDKMLRSFYFQSLEKSTFNRLRSAISLSETYILLYKNAGRNNSSKSSRVSLECTPNKVKL